MYAVNQLQKTLATLQPHELADYQWLLKYEQQVKPQQRLMAEFSHQLATQFSKKDPLTRLARSLALSTLDQHRLLKSSFCQFAMGF